MNTTLFYAELPVLTEFADIGRPERYAPLPNDWHVVMCDVRNSTAAVQAGRYKTVNTVGAAVITALLNAAGEIEIPFIFEGDGAMLCVPPQLLVAARAALLKAQEMALSSFALELRVATLPMTHISKAGLHIQVARHQVSENYIQAVFAGGGMAYAERYMKDPASGALCEIPPGSIEADASFDGLECRWQDIPSRFGETVSVMVRAIGTDEEAGARVYSALIAKVREIYGSDDTCHPVFPPNLTFTFDDMRLGNEVGVRALGRSAFGKWRYLMRVRMIVVLGWFLMRFNIKTEETDWGRYKTILARNADVRKFNDCFRQILAGNAEQRIALTAWLDESFTRGELVYGAHVSDRAQMTCMVFDYAGRHLHFIDGADGGLFMAAKALKERMAARV